MKQKRKKQKNKIKITPSIIVGMIIGVLMFIAGVYTVKTYGGYGGYYFSVLGICFIGLIITVLWTRR